MDAALKSAATPNKCEISSTVTSSESRWMGQPKESQWQNMRPLVPRDERHGQHHSTWMGYELPSTPGPTGLNAVEWLVYFHYLDC
jgi:hypothetical protein